MKNFRTILLVIVIAGGGTFLVLNVFDSGSKQEIVELTGTVLTGDISMTGTDFSLTGAEASTGMISTGLIEEQAVEVTFGENNVIVENKKLDDYTLEIQGEVTGVSSGLIKKISVESCKTSFSGEYGKEYFLKQYKYPNFKYRIGIKFDNICDVAYKINFYSTGEDKLFTKEVIVESDLISKNFVEFQDTERGFSFVLPNNKRRTIKTYNGFDNDDESVKSHFFANNKSLNIGITRDLTADNYSGMPMHKIKNTKFGYFYLSGTDAAALGEFETIILPTFKATKK